jgi:hypothetical protein
VHRVINYLQILCTAIAILSCERKVKENLAIEELPGKRIKTLMESTHDPIENSGKVEYDTKNSRNSLISKLVFNSNSGLISKSVFNSLGNLESKIIIKYDRNGNTVETDTYGSNGSLLTKRVNDFSLNKLIESKEFDAKGKMTEKQTVNFNSDGNEITITFKEIGGRLIKTIESVVNKQGNNTENYYFTNETLTRTEINKYDTRGNRIETAQYDPARKEENITHYKYDGENNNIEVVKLNTNLMIVSKVISTYDDKKNVVETRTYGILGSLTRHVRYAYEFDEAFNWTKQITFVNNRPISVTLHRIEYH